MPQSTVYVAITKLVLGREIARLLIRYVCYLFDCLFVFGIIFVVEVLVREDESNRIQRRSDKCDDSGYYSDNYMSLLHIIPLLFRKEPSNYLRCCCSGRNAFELSYNNMKIAINQEQLRREAKLFLH